MNRQLPLGLGWPHGVSFANYISGANVQAVASLQQGGMPGADRFIYLWGRPGVGKSHLLQALCEHAAAQGRRAAYLPLTQLQAFEPGVLDGLEDLDIVCIDDVHSVARNTAWEIALFHLYNRVRDAHGMLVVSATAAPTALGLGLSDLASRLSAALQYQLVELSDVDKIRVLQHRAQLRGLDLPDDVARYLLARVPRDMEALCQWLERLDQASLAAQRRLTVPFVKALLAEARGAID